LIFNQGLFIYEIFWVFLKLVPSSKLLIRMHHLWAFYLWINLFSLIRIVLWFLSEFVKIGIYFINQLLFCRLLLFNLYRFWILQIQFIVGVCQYWRSLAFIILYLKPAGILRLLHIIIGQIANVMLFDAFTWHIILTGWLLVVHSSRI
jgi:hypothetical protein